MVAWLHKYCGQECFQGSWGSLGRFSISFPCCIENEGLHVVWALAYSACMNIRHHRTCWNRVVLICICWWFCIHTDISQVYIISNIAAKHKYWVKGHWCVILTYWLSFVCQRIPRGRLKKERLHWHTNFCLQLTCQSSSPVYNVQVSVYAYTT